MYVPSSTPAATRQPFPNNVIPAVMISPVAAALFQSSLYPAPINTALQNNAVNTSNSAFNVDQGDLKIDFKASQKDNISYRFTRAYQEQSILQFAGTVVEWLLSDADLQHGWRLDSHDRKQSGE